MKVPAYKYLRHTGAILIAMLLGFAFSCRDAQPVRKNDQSIKTSTTSPTAVPGKMKDCCKVPISRAKMLSAKHTKK